MSNWADKAKSKGGGSLEGKITDYEFTDTFPFGDDQEPGDNIYMVLSILPDGADEDDDDAVEKRCLYLGSGQFLKIGNKGKTLESTDDDNYPQLYSEGEVIKFIASLEENGFPAESEFPDPQEDKIIDFRAMIGWRIRVVNVTDEEATKKYGKRKVTKGKHKGKEFARTYLKVAKVFDKDEAKGKGKSAVGKKASSAKAKAAEADEDADDQDDDDDEEQSVSPKVADKALKAILAKVKGNKAKRDDLALEATRYASANKLDSASRDGLKKLFRDDDYFTGAEERGIIEGYKPGKNPVVQLSA